MKKYVNLLMSIILCLSLVACGGSDNTPEEVVDDGVITIEDLQGYWSPVEGLGQTTSVLICIYVDATSQSWKEYDQYGELTGNTGSAYTDGTVLTITDVPLIGDVEVPIGDENTLLNDTGEVYWVKGDPDFLEKPELSSTYYGKWYLQGDCDSQDATVLTLNEDGTYTRSYGEEGTYTYKEYDQNFNGDTVFRKEVDLSISQGEMYYLESDGQALVHWANDGDDYYIHESALGNVSLLTTYSIVNGSFHADDYILRFAKDNTLTCEYRNGSENRTGTWDVDGNNVLITWDDGETDKAVASGKTLVLNSTGETLENPW